MIQITLKNCQNLVNRFQNGVPTGYLFGIVHCFSVFFVLRIFDKKPVVRGGDQMLMLRAIMMKKDKQNSLKRTKVSLHSDHSKSEDILAMKV